MRCVVRWNCLRTGGCHPGDCNSPKPGTRALVEETRCLRSVSGLFTVFRAAGFPLPLTVPRSKHRRQHLTLESGFLTGARGDKIHLASRLAKARRARRHVPFIAFARRKGIVERGHSFSLLLPLRRAGELRCSDSGLPSQFGQAIHDRPKPHHPRATTRSPLCFAFVQPAHKLVSGMLRCQ